VTSAAEGCYARLYLSGRDFKMLSRLEVKHAKKSPRSVKDRVIMRNRTANTPSVKTAKHPQENLITHVTTKWQLQVVTWKYK